MKRLVDVSLKIAMVVGIVVVILSVAIAARFWWRRNHRPPVSHVAGEWWHEVTSAPTAIVFIHGVLSNPKECWTFVDPAGKKDVYWPDLLRTDFRFKNTDIYVAAYPSDLFGAPAKYGIQQAADTIWNELRHRDAKNRPPVTDKTNIIFVTHSTGGLVAKYMLLEHMKDLDKRNIGVVLIGCPSRGSKLASKLELIAHQANHQIAEELSWNNRVLLDLDEKFQDLVNHTPDGLSGVEGYEERFSEIVPFVHSDVAPQETAEAGYFGKAKKLLGTDHSSTVKPDNLNHPGHQLLVGFLEDFRHRVSPEANEPMGHANAVCRQRHTQAHPPTA